MKIIFISIILTISSLFFANSAEFVIDSDYDFSGAINNTKAPKSLIDSLAIIDVEYYSFDGNLHRGQLVINSAVKDDVIEAFKIMKSEKFPINKVIPIVKYDWSDDKSMDDNNTSAFNYRFIAGTTRLSNHSSGRAVDINPRQNPVIYSDGRISPTGAKHDLNAKGTFRSDSKVVVFLKSRGWRWGGDWTSFKDNHHFDKP
jgi:peptidoglycan LD-endopeptidase CwlK